MTNDNIKELMSTPWQNKIVEYLSYLTIFSIPLFFSNKHMFIFNTPKIIAVMGLVLLMCIFYLWGNWKVKKIKIGFSFLSITMLFFVMVLTISSVFGIDPINSFFGWRNTMPLVAMYALGIFSLIVGNLIKKDKKILIKTILSSFLSSFIITSIFYFDLLNPKYTLNEGSTLGNSSYLGAYLLFNFFFGLGLFLYFKTPWKKILLAISSLFIVVNPLFINKDFLLGKIGISEIFSNPTSLLGIANGATMGVGLSLVFIVFLFMIFSKKKWLKISGLILTIVLLLGVAFVGKELVTTGTSLNKIFTEEKSGNRFLAWDIARQGYLDSPIVGNGFNNYIYNSDKYHTTLMYQKGYLVERLIQPHNVVWEFASNNGVLGVVGYLSLLLVLFITLLNFKNEENKNLIKLRIVLAGLIFGYFIQNLFVFDTVNTYLTLFVLIAIGLGLSNKHNIEISEKLDFLKKIFIAISIVLSLWMIYAYVIIPWNESIQRSKILNKDKILDINKSVKIRDNLSGKSKFSLIMDSTYQADNLFLLYQNALSKVNEENKKIFLRELESIVKDVEKNIEKQPKYSEPYMVVSKILNLHLMIEMKEGNIVRFNGTNYNKDIWQKSYLSIQKSLDLNSNNPQAYLILSQLYMLKADFKNAHLYNKIAITMAPEYKESYNFGRFLLKVNPNKDFENYLNEMEAKWIK